MKCFRQGIIAAITAYVLLFFAPSVHSMAPVISPEVFVDNGSMQLVSSRRVGRRETEYTLKVLIGNEGSRRFENVSASLIRLPNGITQVGTTRMEFGSIDSTGTALSSNELVIRINLALRPSLNDLVWEVTGDLFVEPPPPPPSTKPAEVGMFMYLGDDLLGEVNNSSHRGWVKLLAWSESSSRAGSGFSQGNLNLTKYLDRVSPRVRAYLAAGRFIDEIEVDIIRSCNGNLYTQYAITLVDNVFSGIQGGGSGGEDRLTENISINTRLMETVYTPVDENCTAETPIFSYREMTF